MRDAVKMVLLKELAIEAVEEDLAPAEDARGAIMTAAGQRRK